MPPRLHPGLDTSNVVGLPGPLRCPSLAHRLVAVAQRKEVIHETTAQPIVPWRAALESNQASRSAY